MYGAFVQVFCRCGLFGFMLVYATALRYAVQDSPSVLPFLVATAVSLTVLPVV